MKKGKTISLLAAVLILTVLAYGYWYASTYGWLQVSLRDVSGKIQNSIKNAELTFYDSNNKALAEGRSDGNNGVVYLNHPEAGYCVEEESRKPYSKDDRQSWYDCYEKQAKWTAEWAGKVSNVDLKFGDCSLRHIPVKVSASKGDWWLWWVPLPHQGGKPTGYFYIDIRVDGPKCRQMP